MHSHIKPKSVLLLALSGIGNFIMQSPAFETLKKGHPDWKITVWIAPRGTRPLAEANPNIDDIIESPIKLPIREHLKLVFDLSRRKFDVGIVLSPGQLFKSAAYLFLAGIPKRVGNSYPFMGNPKNRVLLTDAIDELPNIHDVDQNLRLLDPLGIPYNPHVAYDLAVPAANQKKADALLAPLAVPADRKLIGIHPGSHSNMPWKRWPLDRFAEVARTLSKEENAHILIFGGPDEDELKKQLRAQIGDHCSIITADLLTVAAVASRCQLFLANDSGLMHVAAATGITTYGIFGPTDEKLTGPRGKQSQVIRALGTQATYNTESNQSLGTLPHGDLQRISAQNVLSEIKKAF